MTHAPQPLYNAAYRLCSSLPDQLQCGETLLLMLEVTNTGAVPWVTFGHHPVRISYHWHTDQGQVAVDDGLRTALPTPVPPGASTTVEVRVESPPSPGSYHLLIELVEEGFGWFSEKQVAPLSIPITYHPSSGKRASIINGNCVLHDAVGGHVVCQLRALRQAGYQTVLITQYIDPRLPDDVRRHSVALSLDEFLHPDSRHQWVVNHFNTSDVVIVNYSTYYELAELIKLARRSSVLFDYHGVTPPHLWNPNQVGYTDLVRGQENLLLVEYADVACGHSEYTRGELVATGKIPPECTFVLPYAVADEHATPQPPDPNLIAQHHLEGKRVLLYIGRIARNKRIVDLVDALALVREHEPDTVLLLVGENQFGPFREYADEIRQRADACGCGDYVIFTGQVPDVAPYYDLCDLFVTASIHEGFCMPVVEAMSRGKPVVAAASTALPETVGNGGVLFEPENPSELASHIVRLLGERTPTPKPPDDWHDELPRLRERPIAMVCPRYGLEILGGIERHIRGWAEQLVARGYPVEVLTTCTAYMHDWSDHFSPGTETINGVTVRRFATDRVDPSVFHVVQSKAIRGDDIGYRDERAFMQHNLQSSDLNDYLREQSDDYTCVIFAPYLFGTTYWGAQAVPDKALLLPALHDEPVAYFSIFHEMIEGMAGLLFSTRAECDFAVHTLGVKNHRRSLVGYGFSLADDHDHDHVHVDQHAQAFRQRYNLPEHFILYSGRLESGKNVPLLIDYFVHFKAKYGGSLALVLTGTGDVVVPERPDVLALGIIPEGDLPTLYAAATALCQPSLYEGFSIVIMESWLQKRPVLVHTGCAVTRQHVEASGGGYAFDTEESFFHALRRITEEPEHATALGQHGYDYVQEHYTWEAVIERLLHSIVTFTRPRSEYERLAQRGIQRSLAFTTARYHDALLHMIEQAHQFAGVQVHYHQQEQLLQLTRVGKPEYTVRSTMPVVGKLVAWVRQHMTSHLKEPYLDPIIARQEQFNHDVVQTLLPVLEDSLYAQRRLKREVELLRRKLAEQQTSAEEHQKSPHM